MEEQEIKKMSNGTSRGTLYYLSYLLLLLPLVVGCTIGLGVYDKYIQASFSQTLSYFSKVDYILWGIACALFPLGGCIGTFAATSLSVTIGERMTAFICIPVGIVGTSVYILTYFYNSFVIFCIAKFILGLSSGGIMASGVIYLYQIVKPSHHFILSVTVQLNINLGLAICGLFSLEAIISKYWFLTALPLAVTLIISGVVLSVLPESPFRRFKESRDLERVKSILTKIRKCEDSELDSEANNIKDSVLKNESTTRITLWQLISIKRLRFPLFITSLCAVFQQLSGINAAIFYASFFVKSAGFKKIDLGILILLLDCLLGSIIFAFVIPRFGSRFMLVVGHFMMFVSMLAAYIMSVISYVPPWVTVILISQFLFWFQAGPGPKSWIVFSETFNPQYHSSAQGLLAISNWTANLLVTFFFPIVEKYIGFRTAIIFSVLNLLFAAIFLLFMVETKNKTPDQITDEYEKKRLRCCF